MLGARVIELATPVSHLFADERDRARIIAASHCLEGRDRNTKIQVPGQRLFHSDLQPIHEMSEAQFAYFERVREARPDLELATFHVASTCDRPVLDGGIWRPGGRSYSRGEMLEVAAHNFARLRRIFGVDVQLGVENNNYYPTPAYDVVCEPDFLVELTAALDLRFLFDIAHSIVSAANMRRGFEDYVAGLPMERAIQVHVCAPSFDLATGFAYDGHELPNEYELAFLRSLLPRFPGIRFVTVEFYKDVDCLVAMLYALRQELCPDAIDYSPRLRLPRTL